MLINKAPPRRRAGGEGAGTTLRSEGEGKGEGRASSLLQTLQLGAFGWRAPLGVCARWDPGKRPGCSSRPAPHTWIFLSFFTLFFFKALCRFWSC